MKIQNHSHINNFVLSLALKKNLEATRKRPKDLKKKNLKFKTFIFYKQLRKVQYLLKLTGHNKQ